MKPDRLLIIIDKMAYPIYETKEPLLFEFLYQNPKAKEELKKLFTRIK